jgi:hypothetical protein
MSLTIESPPDSLDSSIAGRAAQNFPSRARAGAEILPDMSSIFGKSSLSLFRGQEVACELNDTVVYNRFD